MFDFHVKNKDGKVNVVSGRNFDDAARSYASSALGFPCPFFVERASDGDVEVHISMGGTTKQFIISPRKQITPDDLSDENIEQLFVQQVARVKAIMQGEWTHDIEQSIQQTNLLVRWLDWLNNAHIRAAARRSIPSARCGDSYRSLIVKVQNLLLDAIDTFEGKCDNASLLVAVSKEVSDLASDISLLIRVHKDGRH